MLKSSLLEILRTFSKEELKRFDEFVYSPYFNKKSSVTKLWKEIKKYSPEFESEYLDRKNVYTKLFPTKEFNYGVMKNLIHELTKLMESFLQIQSFESDFYKRQFYLLENFSKRSNKKLFTSKFKLFEEELGRSEKFNSEKFRYMRDFSILNYDFHQSNIGMAKDKDLAYKIAQYEIYSFLVECLKNYNNIITFRLRNNYQKEDDIVEELMKDFPLKSLLEKIKKHSEFDFKILNMYHLMFLATKNIKTPKHYYLYKNFLFENDKYFDDSEKRLLYNFLEAALTLNYTVENRNKEYFEIDRKRIERKIILNENGYISFNEFSAIVRTAADFHDVEFLENFINTYLKNVPAPVRDSAKHFSNAYLFYIKGETEKALQIINNHDLNTTEFRINLRLLKLKILYDKNDFLTSEYVIDSFRHYLVKEIIPETYKTSYLNFCKYLLKLFKLKESPDISECKIVKNEIMNNETANKSWLLEKVIQLGIRN